MTGDEKEILRLINEEGLPPYAAIAIAKGNYTVDQYRMKRDIEEKARAWADVTANLTLPASPEWDRDPANFHLSLDSVDAQTFAKKGQIYILTAPTDELEGALTFNSTRDVGPWEGDHLEKSRVIAFRWHSGLLVTPPYVVPYEGQIQLEGGLHRYHLAKYYGAQEIPFLVSDRHLAAVRSILPSAR